MPSLPRVILVDPNDGCLTIARRLARRGVAVTAVMTPSSAFVGHSRFVDGAVLTRLPEAASDWVATLNELAGDGGGVLISGSDAAVELLCSRRSEIPAELVSFESEESAHLRVMDKAQLYEAARREGIRTPRAQSIRSPSDLDTVAASFDFPCVFKPALSHRARLVTGASNPALVHDADRLRREATPYLERGLEGLAVEYVPGPETRLEGAVTVRLRDGSFPLAYTRRKLRQYPPDFGAGSVLMAHTSPEMLAFARRLLDTVGFVGVSSVEAKRHAVSGELVLIEVNTRIPQNFGLGDACDVDASWRLYSALAGLPLTPQRVQRDGVSVLIPRYELRAARIRLSRGEVSWRKLLREYATVRDAGVLSLRDPRPGFALGRELLRRRSRARR